MDMSIDEAIYCMKSYLPSDEYTHCTECKYYGYKDDGTCASNKAHQMAIDTMHKYQTIEQILNEDFEEYHPLDRDPYRLALIKKVVKDGSN